MITTYKAIQQDPASVIEAYQPHLENHAKVYFYKQRDLDWKTLDPSHIAARMIYLNRATFNGLYRVNSTGKLNISWGNRESVVFEEQNLYAAGSALKNATLSCGDFSEVIERATEGDFVFLDPPYADTPTKKSFRGYTSKGFTETDQRRLYEVCLELDRKGVLFMQTNHACPYIENLYGAFSIIPIAARRSISCNGDRAKAEEVILMNY